MPENMNTLEVVILTDKMPRSLTALVKVPGRGARTITAHWDIAASQFTPAVTDGLNKLVDDIIDRFQVRKKKNP